MKNLYCSFLNSSEVSVSGNRLIYNESEVESSEGGVGGAKKDDSGLWELAKRGQKETQQKIAHLDSLEFGKLKAEIDRRNEEIAKIESNPTEKGDMHVSRGLKGMARGLNERYELGLNLDGFEFPDVHTKGDNIMIILSDTEITIRPDGTFVKRESTSEKDTSFDSRTGKTFYTLLKGQKHPDDDKPPFKATPFPPGKFFDVKKNSKKPEDF